MSRYSYKKIYVWDPPLAYVAGLIASDGCLANDGRHINLTSTDTEILEIVGRILSLSGGIAQKRNGFGGTGFYIQFSNVAFYDFLNKAGIEPAKSKTIRKVIVPSSYYRDFLRGFFDGDGSVYGFQDKRWPKSFMYYVEFTSASPDFLEWIHSMNKKMIGVERGKIRQSTRSSKLTYAKHDAQKIFSSLYYSDSLPTLGRKHRKFVDFIRFDPYANKELLGRVAELVDAYD